MKGHVPLRIVQEPYRCFGCGRRYIASLTTGKYIDWNEVRCPHCGQRNVTPQALERLAEEARKVQ